MEGNTVKFTLAIEMGNAAMLTGREVAEALRDVAHAIDAADDMNGNFEVKYWDAYDRTQWIKDGNGNRVGWWRFEPEEDEEHPSDCTCRHCEPEPVDEEERYIHED